MDISPGLSEGRIAIVSNHNPEPQLQFLLSVLAPPSSGTQLYLHYLFLLYTLLGLVCHLFVFFNLNKVRTFLRLDVEFSCHLVAVGGT